MAIECVDGKWRVILNGKVVSTDCGSRDKARAAQKALLQGVQEEAPQKPVKNQYYSEKDYASMLTKDLSALAVANGITGVSKASRTVVLNKLLAVKIIKTTPVVATPIIPKVSQQPKAQTAPRYKPGTCNIYNTKWYGQPSDGYTLEVNGTVIGRFSSREAVIDARDWCKRNKATSLNGYRYR
jgi:hypothetical protein